MRGSVSVEFLMVMVFLVGAMSVAGGASFAKTLEIKAFTQQQQAEGLARELGGTINTAHLEGDGFGTNVTVPSSLSGAPFNVSVTGNLVLVSVNSVTYPATLLTKNVSGQFKVGTNAVLNSKGEVKIL
ncbi:MAG: hypothetical protein HY369_04815 [Candidatus Aenigmarchaeota archaeon]|nr:hypothetical protein [Candidatus Aenigmarchaeota archaeon]